MKKRIISAVLVSLLLMTVIIPASAFTDDEKIKNLEQVEYLVEKGIFSGYEDGSFRPEDGVTRAQMAKLICLMLGGEPMTEVDYFIDCTSHWAKGYINYCCYSGFISGRGDGTFAPDETLSAFEAAKMLLCAMGNDAEECGYVGEEWKLHVAVDATNCGVFDGYTGDDYNAVLNRDDIALIVYNTMMILENAEAQPDDTIIEE